MWTRARDEPDVKSGEVLQAAVQTISITKAGYSNSQQKGTLIDDFTQHVELFSSKEQQMTEEKYLHTEKDYLDLLLAVKKIRLPTFNCSLYRLFSIKNRHEVWRVSSVNLE